MLSLLSLLLIHPCMAGEPKKPVLKTQVEGTTLVVTKPDGSVVRGSDLVGSYIVGEEPHGKRRIYRIDKIEKDPQDQAGDIFVYTYSIQDPKTQKWFNPCTPDYQGKSWGFPIEGVWDKTGNHLKSGKFSLTCTSGAYGKCVRQGYKPWKSKQLWDLHQACTRMIRADYCGDNQAHTKNGIKIDVFDKLGIQKDEPEPGMELEAAWKPDGAVCLSKTRIPKWTREQILKECPKRLGDSQGKIRECDLKRLMKDDSVLLFNRSF